MRGCGRTGCGLREVRGYKKTNEGYELSLYNPTEDCEGGMSLRKESNKYIIEEAINRGSPMYATIFMFRDDEDEDDDDDRHTINEKLVAI